MTVLTRTTGVKITRRDLTVEAYTSFDRDLTVSSQLYRSIAGYTPTGVGRNVNLRPDTIDIAGVLDGVVFVKDDLRAGDYDGADIDIIIIDWITSTKVGNSLIVGKLGQWRIDNDKYTIELNSIESLLGKPFGRTVSLDCPWDLGDADCGFTLTTDTGSVTSQGTPANRVFVDTSRTEADDYYNGGKVTFTSGDNNGRTMDVKRWVNSTKTFELFEPMFADIATSVTYNVTRGCDKRFSTCRDTFSNLTPTTGKGFGGFPYLPGVTDLLGKQTG